MNYFVTAIGTDSGKTIVSSILVEALKADYWKPVQAGFPTDTETVAALISNNQSQFHPETHLLQTPESPHAAAKKEGISIDMSDFEVPTTVNRLIIEGAGGLLVPLNDEETMIQLIRKLNVHVILVSNLYLGSINHTLLTCELLKSHSIPIRGIIFNGDSNPESEEIIQKMSGFDILFRIPHMEIVNKDVIRKMGEELLKQVPEL